jgi:hypothetical protein
MLRVNKTIIKAFLSVALLFFPLFSFADTTLFDTVLDQCPTNEKPPEVGNFILPYSQQPGPLFTLGQTLLAKNNAQIGMLAVDVNGKDEHFVDLFSTFIYGVTNTLSVGVVSPYAASYRIDDERSNGFEDTYLQGEYAFYSSSNRSYTDQLTAFGAVGIPTGSIDKMPPTGFGSTSYVIGGTYNREYVHWFMFAAGGSIIPRERNGTKFGTEYLYQSGIGRNIFTINKKWIFAAQVETAGSYSERDKFEGFIDPNSGGNVIYVIPSLWLSDKHLIFQVGAGYPIHQNLYGQQKRLTAMVVGNISWTFS